MEHTTTELKEALERASKRIRDPEAMRRASERMDATRQDLRRRFGHDVDIAVPIIRELRDGECATS